MRPNDIEFHVTVLGWINLVGGALFLLFGGMAFMFFAGLGFIANDPEAGPILALITSIIGGLLLLFALPLLIAGSGLLNRKNWARYLAVIVGIFGLANFPVGTAVGIYTFWVLFDDRAGEVFGAPAPPPVAPPATQ